MANLNDIRSTYDCALPTEEEMEAFINNQDITLKIDKHNGRYNLVCYFTPFKGKYLNYIRVFNGHVKNDVVKPLIYSINGEKHIKGEKIKQRVKNPFAVKLILKYWSPERGKDGGVSDSLQLYQDRQYIMSSKSYQGDWTTTSTHFANNPNTLVFKFYDVRTNKYNIVNLYGKASNYIDTTHHGWKEFKRVVKYKSNLNTPLALEDNTKRVFSGLTLIKNPCAEFVIDETSARRGFKVLFFNISPYVPSTFNKDKNSDLDFSWATTTPTFQQYTWSSCLFTSTDLTENEMNERAAFGRGIKYREIKVDMKCCLTPESGDIYKSSKTIIKHFNSAQYNHELRIYNNCFDYPELANGTPLQRLCCNSDLNIVEEAGFN